MSTIIVPVGARVVFFGVVMRLVSVLVLAVVVGLVVGFSVSPGLPVAGVGLPAGGGSIPAGGGIITPGGRVISGMKPGGQCGQSGSQKRKPVQIVVSI